jgi:hypothetical protein
LPAEEKQKNEKSRIAAPSIRIYSSLTRYLIKLRIIRFYGKRYILYSWNFDYDLVLNNYILVLDEAKMLIIIESVFNLRVGF